MRLHPLNCGWPLVPNRNVELFRPGPCYELLGMCVANKEIAVRGSPNAIYRSDADLRAFST
jgi:hypothetical protein